MSLYELREEYVMTIIPKGPPLTPVTQPPLLGGDPDPSVVWQAQASFSGFRGMSLDRILQSHGLCSFIFIHSVKRFWEPRARPWVSTHFFFFSSQKRQVMLPSEILHNLDYSFIHLDLSLSKC